METDAGTTYADRGSARMKDDELFAMLKACVSDDIEHTAAWRKQAAADFKFAQGPGQWDEQDRKKLQDENRPVVTFNKTNKYIRAICGIETNNRMETAYLPRELDSMGEVKANELLSAASQWMEDSCFATRHQSRAFRDATICGMGWTEAIISYDDDPQGLYDESRIHPCEMVWDREARDQNILDAKRVARVRKMRVADARDIIKGLTDKQFSDFDLDASWAADVTAPANEPRTKEQKELREEHHIDSDPKRTVALVQVQWWEFEPYYRAANPDAIRNPQAQRIIDMSEADYAKAQKSYGALSPTGKWPGTKMRRKVYKQAFLGSVLLHSGDCPCPTNFTMNCITWEPNEDGTFSGLIRDIRDPQTWGNKFFAQLMHIVNATAKGGIIAESDAFPDVEEAKRNYARPEGIVVVNPGAISKGKVMAKPGQGFTSGVLNLIQITDQMFSEVTGINLELMGLANRDQAGVLETQRKQAAMTILATLFDSMAMFRERVGRVRLHYIQTVLADGRLIRIAGEDAQEAIPLVRDKVMGKYDVVISDAPTSPNSKEKIWASIQILLPPLMQAGMVGPEHIMVLLDYVPGLPAKLVQAFREMASKPDPAKEDAQALSKRSAEAEVADKEASAQSKAAGAVLSLAKAASEQNAMQVATFEAALAAMGFGAGKQLIEDDGQPIMGTNGGEAPQPLRQVPELGGEPMQAAPMPETSAGNGAMPGGLALPGGLMNGA